MFGTDVSSSVGGFFVAAVVSVAGCAHYKLGATAPDENVDSDVSVSVSTIGVPADWGVDGPRLTRQLVDDLRSRGLPDVAWRGDDDGSIGVRCTVDGRRPDASRSHQRVRVVATCEIGSPDGTTDVRASGRQTTSLRSGRVGPRSGRRATLEYAAADALEQAADRIARRIDTYKTSSNETRDGQTTR